MRSPTTIVPSASGYFAPAIFGDGLTHCGLVRQKNEDAILLDPTGVLWAVADGMGGYGNGDVASDIVTALLSEVPTDIDPLAALSGQLQLANAAVCARSSALNAGMMGATVVAMMIENSIANIVWAGDSRGYLLRSGQLRLLTRDHTVVQDLVENGLLDRANASHHPDAHVVTRAVGGAAELETDAVQVPLVSGDIVMLCSDGLTACVSDQMIRDILAKSETPEHASRALISEALENGAPDNVSVIAVFAGTR